MIIESLTHISNATKIACGIFVILVILWFFRSDPVTMCSGNEDTTLDFTCPEPSSPINDSSNIVGNDALICCKQLRSCRIDGTDDDHDGDTWEDIPNSIGDLNRRYLLSAIPNASLSNGIDSDNNNTPIIPCNIGYLNTPEYSISLEGSDPDAGIDFNNHSKLSCVIDGARPSFGSGSCSVCDESAGYQPRQPDGFRHTEPQSVRCLIPSASMLAWQAGKAEYDAHEAEVVSARILSRAETEANRCDMNQLTVTNGSIDDSSCGDNFVSEKISNYHGTNNVHPSVRFALGQEAAEACGGFFDPPSNPTEYAPQIDENLECPTAPANTVIQESTCSVQCNTGYIFDGTDPSCGPSTGSTGSGGSWTNQSPSCRPITCVPPVAQLGYVIPQGMTCSNTTYGNPISCESVMCEYPTVTDNITYSCNVDGGPVIMSGCTIPCDTSQIPGNSPSNPQFNGQEDGLGIHGSDCPSTGTVESGTTCNFTCDTGLQDGNLTVTDQPQCSEGNWSGGPPICSQVDPDAVYVDVSGAAHTANCDVSNVIAPTGGTLFVADGPNAMAGNCGNHGTYIGNGDSCVSACNDAQATLINVPHCVNGVLSSTQATCELPATAISEYQMVLSEPGEACPITCQGIDGGVVNASAEYNGKACAVQALHPDSRTFSVTELGSTLTNKPIMLGNTVENSQSNNFISNGRTNYYLTEGAGALGEANPWMKWEIPWVFDALPPTLDDMSGMGAFNTCMNDTLYDPTTGEIGMSRDAAHRDGAFCPAGNTNCISCYSVPHNGDEITATRWEVSALCHDSCGARPKDSVNLGAPHHRGYNSDITEQRNVCNCFTGAEDASAHNSQRTCGFSR